MGSENEDFSHFVNADGQKIHCKYWEPETEIRAIAIIIHGYGEHIQRYDKIAGMLTGLGMKACGHDHIGHGKSEGIRIDVKDFQFYVRDSLQHVDMMKEKHPSLPVFIVSHSMGGLINVFMANERPHDFYSVFLSPCFALDPERVTPFTVFAARLASYIVYNKELPKVSSGTLSRDPAVCKDYDEDPLNSHSGIRMGFFIKFYDAMQRAMKEAPKAEWPFLMLHGDADELCYFGASEKFSKGASSKDKTFRVYHGYYHEMDKEPEEYAKVVMEDMREWLKSRLEGGSPKPVEEEGKAGGEGSNVHNGPKSDSGEAVENVGANEAGGDKNVGDEADPGVDGTGDLKQEQVASEVEAEPVDPESPSKAGGTDDKPEE